MYRAGVRCKGREGGFQEWNSTFSVANKVKAYSFFATKYLNTFYKHLRKQVRLNREMRRLSPFTNGGVLLKEIAIIAVTTPHHVPRKQFLAKHVREERKTNKQTKWRIQIRLLSFLAREERRKFGPNRDRPEGSEPTQFWTCHGSTRRRATASSRQPGLENQRELKKDRKNVIQPTLPRRRAGGAAKPEFRTGLRQR